MDNKIKNMLNKMEWLGHDTFRFKDDVVIYIDPYELGDSPEKADLILITHDHYDHLSEEDIKKVSKDDTEIVGPPDCREKCRNLTEIEIGQKKNVKGIKIEAVPAYNIDKNFHPQENRWVGYIISIDDVRIYHAGDTDLIDEMESVDCDIALLPVSGTYVMDADEAVKAAKTIDPEIAVPMHYGAIVGDKNDAEKFKEALKGQVEVHIFE